MKHRTSASLVMALALLVLGVPASAQDEFTGVSFGGVSFAFGPELAASVNATRVPDQPTEPERPPFASDAPHLTFSLYGTSPEGGRAPRVGFGDSTVRAYRVDDLEGHEASTAQLETLRTLLADRSDLAEFMDFSDLDAAPLPHIPADLGAAQSLRARAEYFDTDQLSGIAYLAGYRQDVFPFAARDFVYTFQALSTDGEWFVSGDFWVEATMFPDRVRPRDARGLRRQAQWQAYLQESVGTLNAASAAQFSPPLSSIDILIESITLDPTADAAGDGA